MASADGKEEAAQPERATPVGASQEAAPSEDADKQQAGSEKYGRITDLYAYQTLTRSANVIAQVVRPALENAGSPGKLLVLDDWNYLASGVLLKKTESALAFHAARMSNSIEAITASMGEVSKATPSVAEQDEKGEESGSSDFSGIFAHLQSLHAFLQPTIEYVPRDMEFDADAVRSAVAGALVAPPAKFEVFVPALRQFGTDASRLPLFKTLPDALALRDGLDKKLTEARAWIKNNPDSPQKAAVEKQASAGDDILKPFDAFLATLLDEKSRVMEQALVHAAASSLGATHLLAVKPVLGISQTTSVRAFPLMNENRHFGASVLAYALATVEGRVCAAGIADAEKECAIQPHRANQLLVWLLGAVAVLLALFLLFGAGTLSLAGFRALMTAANPPVTATIAPAATPPPTPPPATTPQGTPGG